MDAAPAEYLSAEELRNRLYHSLRNRGLVDSVKSQLRNSIVTELQTSLRGQLSLRDLNVPDEGTLIHRAANSLVADHFKACQYDYSLSVFLPESGLSQDKVFSMPDILQLLHISPQSRLHARLTSAVNSKSSKGFLWQFLSEMSALHASATHEFGVQTDLIRVGPLTSLDDKLQSLEDLYSSRRDEHMRTGVVAVEDRLLSYQRQLEDRYNSELKRELARMKDTEIARIRLEEREECRRQMDQQRRELERTYQSKYDALVERERNSIERLQREQEIQEKEIYAQRQTLLEEMEVMRQREVEVKRERELTHREKDLQGERNRAKEDEIRRREMEVKRQNTEFTQRLHNEMAQFKLDTQARFIDRTQNIEIRETKVKEMERIVSEEKSKLQSYKDDLRDKTHRVNELETLLQECRHSEVSATRQNEYINSKLRDMADYKTIKEHNSVLRNEMETLRTRLSELLTMNERERGRQEELLRELRRPSPETLLMQRDLERARENLRQEQVLFEQQKQQLETRLKDEIDRNRELVRHYEEQTLQMKEMNREVIDLRQHLAMTHQALNNEVYRKPHTEEGGGLPSASHVSVGQESRLRDTSNVRLSSSQGRLSSSQGRPGRYDARDVYNDIDVDLVFGGGHHGEISEEEVSSAASADVVAEAKYRLKSLEKEAQNLERAYTDFHYQMTNVASVPDRLSPKRVSQGASRGSHHAESPAQSPIMLHRPMSSTPYQQASKRSSSAEYDNDSFEELSGGRDKGRASVEPVPRFDISNMSDDGLDNGKALRVKHRPITVSDLEARPGSPGIMVVAGSESSDGHSPGDDHLKPIETQSGHSPREDLTTPVLPPSSLPPISLDTAWKGSDGVEEERQKLEEERERRNEERRRIEEEAFEKEQEELDRLEGRDPPKAHSSAGGGETEERQEKSDDGIDPVMKQYMAMVQKNREHEKQDSSKVVQKTVDTWSQGHKQQEGSPPHTDNDISVAEDHHSPKGSDDDFEW
ncbi:centriole and centriolar satellite protein OFD1-like [Haliotis cracherodii]|uniref:centriole and centriolar satellite protein OFD1-like n=1 Tax=Haliotis cracherodii TaxID=6455 RepID=UPI0039E92F87